MSQTPLDEIGDGRRLELLVNAIVDYAIFILDIDGTVRSWNAGAERLKGYSASEIVGKPFSVFYTPEDRAAGLPGKALATARGQSLDGLDLAGLDALWDEVKATE